MNAEVWYVISIVGFSLSGVALLTAIILFLKLHIPAIIGDLTGKAAAKELRALREANATGSESSHRPSRVDFGREMLPVADAEENLPPMAQAHMAQRLDRPTGEPVRPVSQSRPAEKPDRGYTTETLSNNATEVLPDEAPGSRATEVLPETSPGSSVTEILSDDATEILPDDATEILPDEAAPESRSAPTTGAGMGQPPAGTTVLSDVPQPAPPRAAVAFTVIKSLVEIHSREVIQ